MDVAPSQRINISSLASNALDTDSTFIEAQVILVWPYSSSNGRLSLLLAEKDVRLRSVKGQVKVTFSGNGAKEVARTRIGVGDLIRLGLKDVSLKHSNEEIATPGRKLGLEIEVQKSIWIEVGGQRNNVYYILINADTKWKCRASSFVPCQQFDLAI